MAKSIPREPYPASPASPFPTILNGVWARRHLFSRRICSGSFSEHQTIVKLSVILSHRKPATPHFHSPRFDFLHALYSKKKIKCPPPRPILATEHIPPQSSHNTVKMSSPKPIYLAVIGTGGVSTAFLHQLSSLPHSTQPKLIYLSRSASNIYSEDYATLTPFFRNSG